MLVSVLALSLIGSQMDTVRPLTLEEVLKAPLPSIAEGGLKNDGELRMRSLKDAAMSFGARSGNVYRAQQITDDLINKSIQLDKIYNFQSMALIGPSGLLIVPPVVTVSDINLSISGNQDQATLADREYRVVQPARIVATAPDWRSYLIRPIEDVAAPSLLSRPKNATERKAWNMWVQDGWQRGVEQANMEFKLSLARLARDFEGVVRYRTLMHEGKVHELHIAVESSDTLVDGNVMRVGDRAIRIVQQGTFDGNTNNWEPLVILREPAVESRFEVGRAQ